MTSLPEDAPMIQDKASPSPSPNNIDFVVKKDGEKDIDGMSNIKGDFSTKISDLSVTTNTNTAATTTTEAAVAVAPPLEEEEVTTTSPTAHLPVVADTRSNDTPSPTLLGNVTSLVDYIDDFETFLSSGEVPTAAAPRTDSPTEGEDSSHDGSTKSGDSKESPSIHSSDTNDTVEPRAPPVDNDNKLLSKMAPPAVKRTTAPPPMTLYEEVQMEFQNMVVKPTVAGATYVKTLVQTSIVDPTVTYTQPTMDRHVRPTMRVIYNELGHAAPKDRFRRIVLALSLTTMLFLAFYQYGPSLYVPVEEQQDYASFQEYDEDDGMPQQRRGRRKSHLVTLVTKTLRKKQRRRRQEQYEEYEL